MDDEYPYASPHYACPEPPIGRRPDAPKGFHQPLRPLLAPLARYEDGGVTEAETCSEGVQTPQSRSEREEEDTMSEGEHTPAQFSLPKQRKPIAIPPTPEDPIGKAIPHLVPELLESQERKELRTQTSREDESKAALLLPQESVDIDLDDIYSSTIAAVIANSQHKDITPPSFIPLKTDEEIRKSFETQALSRPRSTTPVNFCAIEDYVASYESNTASVSGSVLSDEEKIKISLPGEDKPVSRHRRRSSMSWQDFYDNMSAQIPLQSGRMSGRSTPNKEHQEPDMFDAYKNKVVPPSPVVHKRTSMEWVMFGDTMEPVDHRITPSEQRMNTDPGVDRSMSNSSDVPPPPPPPMEDQNQVVQDIMSNEPLPPPPPPIAPVPEPQLSSYQYQGSGISTHDQTDHIRENDGAMIEAEFTQPEAEIEIHISEDSDNDNATDYEPSGSCYYSTASYNFDPNTTSYASTTWDPPAIAILPSTPAPPITDDDDSVQEYLSNDDHVNTVPSSQNPDSSTVPKTDSASYQDAEANDYSDEIYRDNNTAENNASSYSATYSGQTTDFAPTTTENQGYSSHVQSYATNTYSSVTNQSYTDPYTSAGTQQYSTGGYDTGYDASQPGMDNSSAAQQQGYPDSMSTSSQPPYTSQSYSTTGYSSATTADPYTSQYDQSQQGYDQSGSYHDYSSYSQAYGDTSLNDSGYQTHDAQPVNVDNSGSYSSYSTQPTESYSTPAPPPIRPVIGRKDSWEDAPAIVPPSYEEQKRMASQSGAQQPVKISAPPPRPAPPTPTRSPVPPPASSFGDPPAAPSGENRRAPPPKPPPPRPPPARPAPPTIAKKKEPEPEGSDDEDPDAWKKFLAQTEGVAKMAQAKLKEITSATVEKEIKNKHWGIRPESPLKTENIMDSEAPPPPRKDSADWKPISERLEEEIKKEKDKSKPSRPPPPPPPPGQKRPDLTSIPSWDDPNAHEFYVNVPSYSEKQQEQQNWKTDAGAKQNDSESDTGTLKDLTPKDENYNASADLDDFFSTNQNKANGNSEPEIAAEVANWTGFDSEMGLKESESGFFSKLDNREVQAAFEAFEGDASEVPLTNGDNLLMQQSYDPFEIGSVDQIISQVKARTQAEIEADEDMAVFSGENKHNGNSSTPDPRDGTTARPMGFEDEFGAEDEEGDDMSPLFDEDDSEPLEPFPAKFEGDGWNLMLRHPVKKKLMGDRYWKPVFVRLNQGTIQLFHTAKDSRPFHELHLQATYCLSDTVLQQYDIYGKIHTVKLQYVIYKERVGVRPGQIPKLVEGKFTKMGLPLEHAATTTPLLKFGSLEHREISSFVHSVEDVLFHCQTRREQAMVYKQDEVQIHCYDEYEAYVNKEGTVSNQKARVRLFCLAFVSGMPTIEIGLNDRRREGKEIVRRKDIMPMYTDKWIRYEELEMHSTVSRDAFESEQMIKVVPVDGCFFEVMRFRVRPPRSKELPLQVRSVMKIAGSKIEIRMECMVAGWKSRKARQVPCEDIQIRFPIPEAWIYLFREERHWGYGSKHSRVMRPGKVKNIRDRIMGVVHTTDNSLMEAAIGDAKYEHVHRSIVWRIPRLPEKHHGAYKSHLLRCRFQLSSFDLMPETFIPTCDVDFTMPMATVSHTVVRSVSVEMHDDSDRVEKFARYLARYQYQVEVDYVQTSDLDMDAVMDTTVLDPEKSLEHAPVAHKPSVDATIAKEMHEGYRIKFTDDEFGGAKSEKERRNSSSSEDDDSRPKGTLLNIKIDMTGYGY